jgi:hypothetical protein
MCDTAPTPDHEIPHSSIAVDNKDCVITSQSFTIDDMDEYQTSSIINWYEELEERLIEFFRFLPYTSENINVSSPRLAGVVTEICNILDSLFREVSNPTEMINGRPKERDKLDVTDYAELYAKRLNLPTTQSFIFVSPPRYLIPFEKWEPLTTGGTYAALPWWRAYTKLKHSRIKNINQATLDNAVNALCALHQVIAKLTAELGRATLRHGWFDGVGMDQDMLIEMFDGKYPFGNITILATTKLFTTPVGGRSFPANITDLSPNYYYGSFVTSTIKWQIFEAYLGSALTSFLAVSHHA